MGRKVFASIGFPDFAFGISVAFSDCCPATVSDSETVFLCPLSSAAAARSSPPAAVGRYAFLYALAS
jgi:hypothetical protein